MAGNVYTAQNGLTATYSKGEWLCSCEHHPKMKSGVVARGSNTGRPYLRCPNFRKANDASCDIFILHDDPEVIAIEERPPEPRGRKHSSREKNPTRHHQSQLPAAAAAASNQSQSSAPRAGSGSGSSGSSSRRGHTSEASYYSTEDDLRNNPYRPNPTRTRPSRLGAASTSTPSNSRDVPPRRSARNQQQPQKMECQVNDMNDMNDVDDMNDVNGINGVIDDDDYDEYEVMRQIEEEEYIQASRLAKNILDNSVNTDNAVGYGSWDDDVTRDVIKLTDSVSKTRGKSKGPQLGSLPTRTPTRNVRRPTNHHNHEEEGATSPPKSIPRQRLMIAEEERNGRHKKPGAAISFATTETTIPAPTPSRAPPRASFPSGSKQSLPGGWESSESESDTNNTSDEDYDSVLTEMGATDMTGGLATPVTGHGKRFTDAIPSSSQPPSGRPFADRIMPPPSPSDNRDQTLFEEEIARDIFTILERDGIQLPPTTKDRLQRKLASHANSLDTVRKDRNEKKRQVRRLRRELEETKGYYRMLRNRKEAAECDLMSLAQDFDGWDSAIEGVFKANKEMQEELEGAKVKILDILKGMDPAQRVDSST